MEIRRLRPELSVRLPVTNLPARTLEVPRMAIADQVASLPGSDRPMAKLGSLLGNLNPLSWLERLGLKLTGFDCA